ncbi:putative ribosomal L28 family protein [Elsinoe australis]|uniref:Large ribosomal subunit protein bL28m n=1 Tax=Elsinoe australis TaxID=40998 RepID=A0A4U7B6C4_9PEZI|nr:putative ribosomal L28 family protein [Elsinoe australis]
MAFRYATGLIQAGKNQYRSFSSSAINSWKSHTNSLATRHADVPPYPYGPAQWYKQSNKGLYGGQMIRFGNNVGEKSEKKTRRSWHPNLITRNLKSIMLGRFVRVKLTTRVLRTVDKVGGIDAYLLGSKPSRIRDLGMEGWKLRYELLSSPAYRNLAAAEQRALVRASKAQLKSAEPEESKSEQPTSEQTGIAQPQS